MRIIARSLKNARASKRKMEAKKSCRTFDLGICTDLARPAQDTLNP